MICCARLLSSVLRGCIADISSFILESSGMWCSRQFNIRKRDTSSQPSTVLMNLSESLLFCPVTKYDVSTFFTMPSDTSWMSFVEVFLFESNFIIGCSRLIASSSLFWRFA